jgi:hypothetical protein
VEQSLPRPKRETRCIETCINMTYDGGIGTGCRAVTHMYLCETTSHGNVCQYSEQQKQRYGYFSVGEDHNSDNRMRGYSPHNGGKIARQTGVELVIGIYCVYNEVNEQCSRLQVQVQVSA